MKNDFLSYVDQRLEEWANWYAKGNLYGLGYPTCSHEYKVMKSDFIRSTAQQTLPCNESAEQIEALVVEMESQGGKLASALRQQYFGSGSAVKRAKALGISYPQFRVYIGMARQWLAGRLSASVAR